MKTLILAVATFMLLVGCEKTETIADIVVTEQPVGDVTLEFVDNQPYTGATNFFISTYCLSNNTERTLDSVKITFTNVTSGANVFLTNFKPNEKAYPQVTHNSSVTVRYILEWW